MYKQKSSPSHRGDGLIAKRPDDSSDAGGKNSSRMSCSGIDLRTEGDRRASRSKHVKENRGKSSGLLRHMETGKSRNRRGRRVIKHYQVIPVRVTIDAQSIAIWLHWRGKHCRKEGVGLRDVRRIGKKNDTACRSKVRQPKSWRA